MSPLATNPAISAAESRGGAVGEIGTKVELVEVDFGISVLGITAIIGRVLGVFASSIEPERAGVVGFMLVIGLFLLGLTNDIGRLTSGGGLR